jgi:hypothetical protein
MKGTSRFISIAERLKRNAYWLDRENFDLKDAFSYRMTGRDKREVKRIEEDNL